MTKIVWDLPEQRVYTAGIDRGVLYLTDRTGVAWNGLVNVVESPSGTDVESSTVYFEGKKVDIVTATESYKGTLNAVFYPDEFLEFDGYYEIHSGLLIDNQPSKTFHMSYRSLVNSTGDYKIHLLYNLTAVASEISRDSHTEMISPTSFSWDLSSVQEPVSGYKPTAHAILDSRYLRPDILEFVEDILYGTDDTPPVLPTLEELTAIILEYGRLIIIDHGDGTWTAKGPDERFNIVSSTEFELLDVDATYLDGNTYTVRSDPLD